MECKQLMLKTLSLAQVKSVSLCFNMLESELPHCKQVYEQCKSSLLPGDVAVGALLMGDLCEGHGSSLYSVA